MKQADFLALVNPFKGKVYRLAKRLLVSTEEAEDATQEVLLKLWSKRNDLAKYKSAEALAMTMTRNFCLDRLKSKQAGNVKLVHSNYSDNGVSIQKHTELKDSVQWIERLMNTLPPQQRIIMQLRDIEAYDFDEISEVVGMNETAIRVALSRARKKLKIELLKRHNYGIS